MNSPQNIRCASLSESGRAGHRKVFSLLFILLFTISIFLTIPQFAVSGEGTLYTCGMHPQVVQDKPGTCPICGMDLVPLKKPGATTSGKATKSKSKGERKIKYWVAPMDPTYISDKPGKSPMGMDLVPMYEDESNESSDSNMIAIDPVVVQNMGVRIAPVKRGRITRSIRTIGEVEVAEDLLSVVNLRFSGWLVKVFVEKTGTYVRKGAPLFKIYSPEVLAAQEELLLAIRTSRGGASSALARSAARRLSLFGIPRQTVDTIIKTRKARETLTIRAPQSGYVLHKNAVEGSYAKAGTDIYRIAELNPIWVLSQVYEQDVPFIKVGQDVEMELSMLGGKRFSGKITFIYPTLDKKSRTVTIRSEFSNPSLELKPGMFATVIAQNQVRDETLLVPEEAIIRTGERNVLFVSPKLGHYEAREVTLGLTGDNRMTEVLSGVSEGEQVVLSGQFLLDSESQLQEAINKLLEARLQRAKKSSHSPKQTTNAPDKATTSQKTGASSRQTMDMDESHQGASHSNMKGQNADEQKSPKPETKKWTCKNHPFIEQNTPGDCPIDGLPLIPKAEK